MLPPCFRRPCDWTLSSYENKLLFYSTFSILKMPCNCCVARCKTNYESSQKENIKLFQFPADEDECKRWVDALPNIIKDPSKNMVVCEKHWPPNYPTFRPPRSKYDVSRIRNKHHSKYRYLHVVYTNKGHLCWKLPKLLAFAFLFSVPKTPHQSFLDVIAPW